MSNLVPVRRDEIAIYSVRMIAVDTVVAGLVVIVICW